VFHLATLNNASCFYAKSRLISFLFQWLDGQQTGGPQHWPPATNHKFLQYDSVVVVAWASCYYPLLGRTRTRCRCWAAIQLSQQPKPLGNAVHGERDGSDIGGLQGWRFVLLRHTQRPHRAGVRKQGAATQIWYGRPSILSREKI